MEVQNVIIKMMLEIDFIYVLQASKMCQRMFRIPDRKRTWQCLTFQKGCISVHYELNVTFATNYILLSTTSYLVPKIPIRNRKENIILLRYIYKCSLFKN